MMLEVLGCGLHGLHNMRCGEGLAVLSRGANQQAAHEHELRRQHCKLPLHRGLRAGFHPLFSKRELAADDGIDEKILHDVRILVEERRVEPVVGNCVLGGEALQRCARPIADARCKGVDALDKARPHIGLVQHHPGKPKHHIQLGRRVRGQIRHRRPQRSLGHRRLKVQNEFRNNTIELASGNRIQTRAKHT